MTGKKVLLGFSGGVDSCASASVLLAGGCDVVPVTLKTVEAPMFLDMAFEAAGRLGLELRVIDVVEEFKKNVIDYFIKGYLDGETPAPCTVCNRVVKWRILYETAKREGFDHIATGHYFRIHRENGLCFVKKAADVTKDQSYYLWDLPQEYLDTALTPMGERIKKEVQRDYPMYGGGGESMGVCFLEGKDYAEFIKGCCKAPGKGDIVDKTGRTVGSHEGYPFYTIGQKRGLDALRKGSVIGIDAQNNRLVIGDDSDLYSTSLEIRDWNVPDPDRLLGSRKVSVKVRGFGWNPEGYAHIGLNDCDDLVVSLESPAWACAKGQPVVFYEGDLVLGGGFLQNYW